MSKGLQPEDCLRGHQIIATERIEAMLRRAGFELRENRGGTSHRRYIHKQYHEIALNVIAGTDKRDTQVRAAKAVLRVQAMKTRKKPSGHELWLRQVAGRIDAVREDYEIGEHALIVTSHEFPFHGTTIPFDTCAAAAQQQIEQLRRGVHDIAGMLERLEQIYDIATEMDGEGVLHAYQPEWRAVLNLKPYTPEAEDPLVAMTRWETQLRECRQFSQRSAALEDMARNLGARCPDDEIIVTQNGLIVRDATWPEIGVSLALNAAAEDIELKHREMKARAAAFDSAMTALRDTYEFKIRRGNRTLYIDHLVYERMSTVMRRYARPGDNEKVFDLAASLEAAVRERDREFKTSEAETRAIRLHCRNLKKTTDGGLVHYEGDLGQSGTRHFQHIRFVETPQARRSLLQDAALFQSTLETWMHDFPRAVRAQGYRADPLPDGGLRLTHMHYEGVGIDMPDYQKTRAVVPTLTALAEECLHAKDFESALREYKRVQDSVWDGFMTPMAALNRDARARFAQIDAQFKPLHAELTTRYGYVARHYGTGRNAYMQYGRIGNPTGHGPQQFTVPVVVLGEKGHETVIFTAATIDGLRHNLSLQHLPPPFMTGKKHTTIADAVSALTSQQDVKGPLTAIALAGGNRPQYKVS